jgi:cell division septal protein FtsQ
MAGGDRLFQLEIIIQEQQAIAAVIGDQQGAVIGAGQLAQIAPSCTSLSRLPLSRSSRVTEPALWLAVTRRGALPSS